MQNHEKVASKEVAKIKIIVIKQGSKLFLCKENHGSIFHWRKVTLRKVAYNYNILCVQYIPKACMHWNLSYFIDNFFVKVPTKYIHYMHIRALSKIVTETPHLLMLIEDTQEHIIILAIKILRFFKKSISDLWNCIVNFCFGTYEWILCTRKHTKYVLSRK